MINIVSADGRREREVIAAMRARAASANEVIDRTAAEILANVKENGFSAVREYSLKFDRAEPREISSGELEEAYAACAPSLIAALEHAAANIRAYNEKLLSRTMEWTSPDGGAVGRVVRGLTRVGVYVPGGTAAYPSSVLMNVVPAKVAGVEEIVMVTPPTENLNTAVLAAAKIAGVDRVIAVGGAQAVAALTYGAGFIPRVDKLVGPGNAYVAAAKRKVFGRVGIDMIAGPSEILVICDGKTDPDWIAMDLFSQAEHDVLAQAVLLTPDAAFADAVEASMDRQIESMPRKDIIRQSLANRGAIIVTRDLEEACRIADTIAPEHLEMSTDDPEKWADLIHHAGAIFLGRYSSEALGDYCAGPNHVLPTSRTARFSSPLGVYDFQKRTSMIYVQQQGVTPLARIAECLGKGESLYAHAASAHYRIQDEK